MKRSTKLRTRVQGPSQPGPAGPGRPEWRENGLVYATRIGTPIEPDNLRRSWGRIRTTAGLTSTRFHDMRHMCVSLLLHLGVAPDMVREIVGQATSRSR